MMYEVIIPFTILFYLERVKHSRYYI
jgi:molecular chaperone DnaJ